MFASVRLRTGEYVKTEESRRTGNGVAALFRHDTSRLLDPQLHTHLVFANMSWDRESQRWLALQPKQMAEQSKEWIRQGFYREFAQECRKLGYITEPDGEAFRLKGISSSIERAYSQRTLQRERFEERYKKLFGQDPSKKRIEQFIKDHKATATRRFRDEYEVAFGKEPSRKEVSEFVQEWRSSKMIKATREEVESIQRDRITSEQMQEVRFVVHRAQNNIGNDERQKVVVDKPVNDIGQPQDRAHEQIGQTQMPKQMHDDWQESLQALAEEKSPQRFQDSWVEEQQQLQMPRGQWEDWQQSLQRRDEVRRKNHERSQKKQKRKNAIQKMRRIRKAASIGAALNGHPNKVMGYRLQQLARLKHGAQRRIHK